MTSITFNCVKLRGNYILQLFITTAKTNTLVEFKAKKIRLSTWTTTKCCCTF